MEKQAQVWTIKDNYRLGKDIPSQVLAFAFGLSAQIERDLISQRTKQALDRLKANGVKLGRRIGSGKYKPKLIGKEEEIIKMVNQGYSKKEIAYRFDVSPQSIWSFLKEKSPAHILKRRQNERD
jgi:DNA invertase Pin-like site-specific DNA recombinase